MATVATTWFFVVSMTDSDESPPLTTNRASVAIAVMAFVLGASPPMCIPPIVSSPAQPLRPIVAPTHAAPNVKPRYRMTPPRNRDPRPAGSAGDPSQWDAGASSGPAAGELGYLGRSSDPRLSGTMTSRAVRSIASSPTARLYY